MEKTVKKKGRICRVILVLLLIIVLLVGAIAGFTAVNASKKYECDEQHSRCGYGDSLGSHRGHSCRC